MTVRELTTEDYQEAADTLRKVAAKAATGGKLKRKERALLAYAALSQSTQNRLELVEHATFPGIQMHGVAAPETSSKVLSFYQYLHRAQRTFESGISIGEDELFRSVISDFELVFADEIKEASS